MNINKSSWHFKLLDYWDFKVVGGTLFTSCMASVVALFASAFLYVTVGAVIGLVIFFGASWLPVIEHGGVIDTMYTVGLSVCLVFAVIQTFELMKAQVREGKIVPNWMKFSKQEIKPNKEVKPNILFEYVKAKKNKFCPVVKLGD